MRGLNRVILVGHAGCNPVLCRSGGRLEARLWFKTYEEEFLGELSTTDWHPVKVKGRTASLVAQTLRKGMPAVLEGRLKTVFAKDEDSEQRDVTWVVVDEVFFFGATLEETPPKAIDEVRVEDDGENPGVDSGEGESDARS